MSRCQATTESGERCKNTAGDDGYCHIESHSPGPGRPDKFTDERAEQACEMATHGASLAGCARAAGVHATTLQDWLSKYPEFRKTFRRARAKGEKERLNEDSQHARFILARSYKYEETKRADVTSNDEKVDTAPVVLLPDNGKRKDGGSD